MFEFVCVLMGKRWSPKELVWVPILDSNFTLSRINFVANFLGLLRSCCSYSDWKEITYLNYWFQTLALISRPFLLKHYNFIRYLFFFNVFLSKKWTKQAGKISIPGTHQANAITDDSIRLSIPNAALVHKSSGFSFERRVNLHCHGTNQNNTSEVTINDKPQTTPT